MGAGKTKTRPQDIDSRINEVHVKKSGTEKKITIDFTVWNKHEVTAVMTKKGRGKWRIADVGVDIDREEVYEAFPTRILKVAKRSALNLVHKMEAAELI